MKFLLIALTVSLSLVPAVVTAESPSVITAKTETKQLTCKVKGMACQSCANHLTSVLGKTKGVTRVNEVDFKTGEVTVTYNPKTTDEAKIKAAINRTQYHVIEPEAP